MKIFRPLLSFSILVLIVYWSYFFFRDIVIPDSLIFVNIHLGEVNQSQALLAWTLPLAYLLVAGKVCLAINIFKPLNLPWEEGLIASLTKGFVLGVGTAIALAAVIGAVLLIMVGLFEGRAGLFVFFHELKGGPIWGFNVGLAMGLMTQLFVATLEGCQRELS